MRKCSTSNGAPSRHACITMVAGWEQRQRIANIARDRAALASFVRCGSINDDGDTAPAGQEEMSSGGCSPRNT